MTSRDVAEQWYHRAATVAHGHYRAALWYSRLNYVFGIPSLILATFVGTAVFASLQSRPEFEWQIIVGLMSIAAAILSALQSFFAYPEKAERHRVAGARYNAVGRELELWLSMPEADLEKLEQIRARVDALSQESPHIPQAVHKHMERKRVEFFKDEQ
jgi:hypothetical protein